MLAKTDPFLILEHCTNAPPTGTALLIYYFCDNREEKRNTAVAILRGLIFQLLRQEESLYRHILPVFQTQDERSFTSASFETLWRIFESMVRDPCIELIYCVLDGLDECEEPGLEMLVEKIADFYRDTSSSTSSHSSMPGAKERTSSPSSAVCLSLESSVQGGEPSPTAACPSSSSKAPDCDALRRSAPLKIIAVSRQNPRCLPRTLSRFPQIKLDPDSDEEVHRDLEAYITTKVDQLSIDMSYPDELRASVKKALSEQADGTFLWVGFVVRELRNKARVEVEEALKSLPSGLERLYERMLTQIPENRRDIAASILRWVTMAVRPLTLTELGAAVEIVPIADLSLKETVRDYVEFCGCLLTITNTVDLVHQSAKDFLLRGDPMVYRELEFLRAKDDMDLNIVNFCVEYLSKGPLKEGTVDLRRPSKEHKNRLRKYPLLKYAVLHWPDHARRCSGSNNDIFSLSHPFYNKKSALRRCWWDTYVSPKSSWCRNRAPSNTSSVLHMAAFLGIVPLVQNLLRKRWRLPRLPNSKANKRDSCGRTSLHYAAIEGHLTVVHVLLEHGADPNRKEELGLSSLHFAVRGGSIEVVRSLIEHGADVNVTGKFGNTPLHTAGRQGHEAIAVILLKNGANALLKDLSNRTPVLWTLSGRHERLLRLLLEVCGSLQPLHAAVIHGRREEVRLLLEQGADVNSPDDHGMTPLSWAVWRGNEAMVQLLLRHAADIVQMIRIHDYWLSEQAVKVARLLLAAGMDLHERDRTGRTLLHHAAFLGLVKMSRLFLDHGANVNAENAHGDTPLSYADKYDHQAVVQLLLEHGADPSKLYSKASSK